jgi:RNA polymerase sigma-70 factor (family 1)
METDIELVERLYHDDKEAFNIIYKRYAKKMLTFVYVRVKDQAAGKEIVQTIFLSLWINRRQIEIRQSLEAYLYGACKYKVITHERAKKVRRRYAEEYLIHKVKHSNPTESMMNTADLHTIEEDTLDDLPPKCQAAYRYSRQDQLKIEEVAAKMGISKRTVENYISQALRALRKSMIEHEWFSG